MSVIPVRSPRPLVFQIARATPIIIMVIAVFGTSLLRLFERLWSSPDQSQGLVIVPFAVLLAWLRRQLLFKIPPQSDSRGVALAAVGCVLHLFGLLAAGLFVSQMAFVMVLAGVIWTFWGASRLRALVLPLVLLVVAVPLPSFVYVTVSLPLQLLASRIACWAADLGGIAIFREGNILHLAGMSVGVWEACSGLNSLSTLVAGAIVLGFLLCRLALTRVLVCIAAIPIAVMANISRVTGTAILGDWNPVYAVGFYHAFSGWLVFLLGVTALYVVARGFRRLFES